MSTLATCEPPEHRPRRRRSERAGPGPNGPAGRGPAPRRPPSRQRRESERLRRLAAGFTQAFLEVESGRRARTQLHPVLCPELALRLADVWVRGGPPGRALRTYGVRVSADRYEAVTLVRRGARYGAVVVALTRTEGAWRVTDAARPEDRVAMTAPLAPAQVDSQHDDTVVGTGPNPSGPLG
ncbi:MAG TPA: Rv3235 family protein [Egibacteraceae bacterium]|jgi:hypothetical protein|nr:Rv3235 family protein [Egibacteraceae bacterium]